MPTAIHVPRINNNDDEVKLVSLKVAVGDTVTAGQLVAEVETDKAVVEVDTSASGIVLALRGSEGETLRVGSILIWLGETADEQVPDEKPAAATAASISGEPTAKARALLQRHGLRAEDVAASGARLSVQDVESHLSALGLQARSPVPASRATSPLAPAEPGALKTLRGDERGMLSTVTWHRDEAVAGYIELAYDPAPWDAFAKQLNDQHGLLLNPLLPLMAWSLAQLATEQPPLNATIVGDQRYEYSQVNLGFTVQAGQVLYLAVVRDAGHLTEIEFVNALIDLQRRAAGHHLSAQETQGTTVGFSSMARWKVGRHVPVLAPHTSLMVAHTVDASGQAVLGATYDHRVLHGAAVAQALRQLSKPRPAR
jgi:pyruvate dehydrogenase E2 component (dihydrolipoamide acetyltransferase)